jgi:hypothetical protein
MVAIDLPMPFLCSSSLVLHPLAYDPSSKNDTNTPSQFVTRIPTANPSLREKTSVCIYNLNPYRHADKFGLQIVIRYLHRATHDTSFITLTFSPLGTSKPFFAVVLNMPSLKPIPPEMKAALLECFLSATRLLPLRLRSSFVLIGGAASIFRGSPNYTEDVDVAPSFEAVFCFRDTIASGTTQFKCSDPLQPIELHCSQGSILYLELLQLGGGFVDSFAMHETSHDGFIASWADLLALRGVTVADQGNEGDLLDFEFLLRKTVKKRPLLPQLNESMLAALKVAEGKLSRVDALADSVYLGRIILSNSIR